MTLLLLLLINDARVFMFINWRDFENLTKEIL